VSDPVAMVPPRLEVRDLVARFHTRTGVVHAVNGISYDLAPGEAMAIVGESGSGKTVSALALMGLVPSPGVVESGRIVLNGRDITGLSTRQWRNVRGKEIAMIFQDPMTSLNPVLTVGYQMREMLRVHEGMSRRDASNRATELLRLVGIPDAERRLSDYPHEFSGGQRQRIMIAMALSCGPSVLIADEPTTALDVTIQAQIVELVQEIRRETGTSILWITHDLALVAGLVDKVAVMYAGTIVEMAPVTDIYRSPLHPYTIGLLRSMPRIDDPARGRLQAIEGNPPDLRRAPARCPFVSRCEIAVGRCRSERPPLLEAGPNHGTACWRWSELGVPPDSELVR
jgi:oligopeptide transport system ATP-binding protein